MKILIETEITAKREDGETPQQEALQGAQITACQEITRIL